MNFLEAVGYIDDHAYRGVVPGLDRMQFLMDLLGDPQRTAPAIHITGTNGKGSTARMVTAVLRAGGLTTGTYTSPHLQSLTERIAINGLPLAEDEFAATLAELVPYFDHMESVRGEGPTYFEIPTVMALAAFADRGIDAMVIEVGLGGRWDATNVVDGAVAVVTNVDLDHVNYLGTDRLQIATEKAGIIKPGAVAVTGEQDEAVVAVLAARCDEVGAELLRGGLDFEAFSSDAVDGGQLVSVRTRAGTYSNLFLPLHGRHQAANAACAIAALEAFHGGAVAEAVMSEGFREVRSPGRLEVVGHEPLVVLDVAHNPHGARALAAALPEAFSFEERWIVIGVLEDKDRTGMLAHLAPGAHVVATAAADPHSVPAEVLAKEAEEAGALSVRVEPEVPAAVDRARGLAGSTDLVLITGSHYSVGEARTHLVGPGPAV